MPTFAQSSTSIDVVAAANARQLANGRDLTLRLLVPAGTGKSIDVVIQAFFEQTGIRVTKTESSIDGVNADMTLDFLSQANQFDIALPATFGILELAQFGVIHPVTSYMDRYEPVGFREDVLYKSGNLVGADTYGFQADGDTYLMFYNNAILKDRIAQDSYADTYGTLLEIPQTWEELDQQMAFFHRPEEGQTGGLLFRTQGYVAWEWWVRFHAKGYWPFNNEMAPQINSDAGVLALEEMVRASESLDPDTSHLNLFQNWNRFAEGHTYCNIGWGGSQKHFQSEGSAIRNNVSYSQLPGGVVDGELLRAPYFNWGWTYVVASSCVIPEIAYLFNLFASSPKMSTRAIQQTDGFFDPYRPEHYRDPAIQSTYTKDFLAVHRESLENSIPDLYLYRQSEYFRTLGEWVHHAINQDVSPERALEAVVQRWETITASVGHSKQLAKWEALKADYPSQIQGRLKEIS